MCIWSSVAKRTVRTLVHFMYLSGMLKQGHTLTHLGDEWCQNCFKIMWNDSFIKFLVWLPPECQVTLWYLAPLFSHWWCMVALGVYYAWVNRGQGSSRDFLTRGATVWQLCLSTCALSDSYLSAILVLANPAVVRLEQIDFLTGHFVSDPACWILTCNIFFLKWKSMKSYRLFITDFPSSGHDTNKLTLQKSRIYTWGATVCFLMFQFLIQNNKYIYGIISCKARQ